MVLTDVLTAFLTAPVEDLTEVTVLCVVSFALRYGRQARKRRFAGYFNKRQFSECYSVTLYCRR